MFDKSLIEKNQLRKDRILSILQIGFYLGYVSLWFVTSGIYTAVYIVKLILIVCSFLIKLYRQCKRKITWRQIIEIQLGFYIIYLSTGFQLVFQYKATQFVISMPLIGVLFSTIIISNLNYSLITNQKSITLIEFVVYSTGIIIQMCLNIKSTVITIETFYGVEGGSYFQSFILLTTSTIITIGASILEKLYSSYKMHIKALQQVKEKKSIEIELAETLNSRN